MKRLSTRRGVVAAAILALFAVVLVAPIAAQSPDPLLTIRAVDSQDPENVLMDVVWSGDSAAINELRLTEQGEPMDVAWDVRPAQPPVGVMFVVDQTETMDSSNVLATARATIDEWIAEADPSTGFGIVGVADTAVVLQELTTNRSTLARAVERLSANPNVESPAMWSGVRLGAAALRGNPNYQGNLAVIVGSNDVVSDAQESAASGELRNSGAVPFISAYTGGSLDTGPWAQLAATGGGQIHTFDDGTAVAGVLENQQEVIADDQYRLSFSSPVGIEAAEINAAAVADAEEALEIPLVEPAEYTLSIGGEEATALVPPGALAVGVSRLTPDTVELGGGISALQGSLGLGLVVVVALIASALVAFAIVSLFVKDDGLSSVLQPYSEGYLAPGEEADDERSASALMERAATLAESVAESQGRLAQAENALERADMPLRVGEALAFYLGVVVLSAVAGFIVMGNILGVIIFGFLGALVPVAVVKLRISRRSKKFVSQLPDTLQLLSGTLRAGYSLMQGVEAVSGEIEDPMGAELRRVVTESRLGRPLEESLEQAAERMNSPDFGWAVMAIRIQREVGGNLADLLLTVADTMVSRERLRRDVASLTAEGRVSAIVLGILPLGLGVVMFALNPDYSSVLLTETIGQIMLGVALLSMLIGFLWMNKIMKIEI